MGTWALRLAYDGRRFFGFARQDGLRTVQGELETALATVLREEVRTVGAGRTDAGVHALGQVVSFATGMPIEDAARLARSCNALTGEDLVVLEARPVPDDFDARRSAVAREYRYRIVMGPMPPLFLRAYAWHVSDALEIAAMRAAAAHLIGEHDFRSFAVSASTAGQRTHRRIDLIDIEPSSHLGEHCIEVRVVGNAFLHSMVRVIVGTLAEVGRGRRAPAWVGEVLAARDRAAAGPTAPAHGLTLWHVHYPEGYWL